MLIAFQLYKVPIVPAVSLTMLLAQVFTAKTMFWTVTASVRRYIELQIKLYSEFESFTNEAS